MQLFISTSILVKKLHKLVLKSYLGPLLMTFFIAMFILLMQFLWRWIDDLVGKGLETTDFIEIIVYASSTLVPMALPLAILLASLMTMGNFGEYYELLAMKSAGVSLPRILLPLALVTALISCGAFFFANNVLPYTNLKLTNLLYSVKQQKPEFLIKEGIFTDFADGFSIKVGEKIPKTGLLKRIMIYDHSDEKGNVAVTYADSGYMEPSADQKFLIATLFHGHTYKEVVDKKGRVNSPNSKLPAQKQVFEKQKIIFELQGIGLKKTDETLFKDSYQVMNIAQLGETRDSLDAELSKRVDSFSKGIAKGSILKSPNWISRKDRNIKYTFDVDSMFKTLPDDNKIKAVNKALASARATKNYVNSSMDEFRYKKRFIARHRIEWHRKFTLSFACLIFFFIGAPLGAIIRKGGLGMPVVVSVLFFIVYYIITITGEKFARELLWSTTSGMWLSSIILLFLGLFLSYKATTDSVIMNAEAYTEFFKKINGFFKRMVGIKDQDETA